MLHCIKTNLRLIKVITSCNKDELKKFIDDNIDNKKLFYKKYYVWNLLRGRDFYRTIAWYIATLLNSTEKEGLGKRFSYAEFLIHIIIETTRSRSIKESFVSNLTKQTPVLTIDILQYINPSRLYSMIGNESSVIADRYVSPFIEKLVSKQIEIDSLKNDINALNSIIND